MCYKPEISRLSGMQLLSIVLLILFTAYSGFGADFYVATTGNDSDPGTEALPWKTLAKAGSTALAGDTVYIRAGTYNETLTVTHSGTPGAMITFKAYPGDECQGEYGGVKTSSSVILDGENEFTIGVRIYPESYIRIEGFEITGYTWLETIYVNPYAGTANSNIEIVNNYIHDNNGYAIHARGGGASVSNLLIENNEMSNNGEAAIFLAADGALIKGNNIHYNEGDGIDGGGNNIVIENNKFYNQFHTDKHQDGLAISGMTNSIIRYNIIYDFTQLIYFPLSDEPNRRIENVEIYGNVLWTDKYWVDAGSVAPGISIRAEEDTATVINVDIHSNTIGWVGLQSIQVYAGASTTVSDINIRNNILYGQLEISGTAVGKVDSDYNLFYGVGMPGFEGSHSFVANPELVSYDGQDSTSFDFHLQSTSPAIDSGANLSSLFVLPTPFLDIDGYGRPRNGSFDIGAYEYVSGPVDTSPPSTPQDLGATAASQTQIDLSWELSNDPESGISYYKIYRDNTQIDTTTATTYSDTGLSSGTSYSYQVSAVNGAGLESARSNAAQATTRSAPSDTTPPTILGVTASSPVHVLFSEPLDQTSAEITANYSISPGITISSATLQGDIRTVILETSDHQEGIDYTLTVNGVMDLARNPTVDETEIYQYNDGLVYSKTSASSFNGVDSFVQIPTSGMSAGGGTIALSTYAEDLSGSRYIFGHTVGSWSNRIQLYIRDGNLGLGLGDTNSRHTNIASLQPRRWYHVALTWNGSAYVVYLDGLQKAAGSYSELTELNTFADIGNTGNTTWRNQEAFSGFLDDVFIYDRALNADEILALHKTASKRGSWDFKEYSALSAADSTNNNNSASLVNGPLWTGAGELKLDGIDDYVDCGSGASSNLTGDLTVTAWIYPDSFGGDGLGRIVDKGDANSGFAFYVRESTRSIAYLIYGGDFANSTTDVIDLAQWQHVAVTYSDTSHTVTFYVNGQPTGGGNYQTNPNDSANAPLIIGNRAASDRGFKGMLSDVRIYSRTLAAEEIAAIYYTYEVTENKPLAFDLSTADSDGSILDYVVQNPQTLPAGATFTDNFFTWRPWYNQAGSYEITFEVPGQPDLTQSVPMVVEDVSLKPWYRRFLGSEQVLKY